MCAFQHVAHNYAVHLQNPLTSSSTHTCMHALHMSPLHLFKNSGSLLLSSGKQQRGDLTRVYSELPFEDFNIWSQELSTLDILLE